MSSPSCAITNFNDYLKVIFDDRTEPQMVPKLLLHVYLRELHNSLVSDSNDHDIKDAREEENNTIIRDSTLQTLLPPQLRQMLAQYMVMYGCECCISDKTIHAFLLSWRDWYVK